MAGFSISGLASGLDTSSIISQLMQLEAMPQTLLKSKASKQSSIISALQGINAKVASLATNATGLKAADSLSVMKASSSHESTTASASASASPTSLTFDVASVATAHKVVTGTISDPADGSTPSFSLTVAGVKHDLTAASWSAADIATAINDKKLGVTATQVKNSDGTYRMQVTADKTGAASDFVLSDITNANKTDQLAPAFAVTNTVLKDGSDAQLDFLAADGTTVAYSLTSSTNTFTDVAPGVSVTVSAQQQDVTVTVGADAEAATTKVKDLVSGLNTVLQDISYRTKAEADGATSSAAVLVGDSLMRNLTRQLQDAVIDPVGTTAVSTAGINIDRSGTVTFDEAAFSKLLTDDPAKAQELVAKVAERLESIAKTASGSTGTITQTITSQEGTVKDLNDRIAAWDARLEVRRGTLERQYAALEVALSRNQSQSQWLAGALAGLPRPS